MKVAMGESSLYIYYRYPPWEVNDSIYRETILSETYLKCLARGRFPGKRGFFGGLYVLRKWGLEIFWGKCLSEKV